MTYPNSTTTTDTDLDNFDIGGSKATQADMDAFIARRKDIADQVDTDPSDPFWGI